MVLILPFESKESRIGSGPYNFALEYNVNSACSARIIKSSSIAPTVNVSISNLSGTYCRTSAPQRVYLEPPFGGEIHGLGISIRNSQNQVVLGPVVNDQDAVYFTPNDVPSDGTVVVSYSKTDGACFSEATVVVQVVTPIVVNFPLGPHCVNDSPIQILGPPGDFIGIHNTGS